MEIRYSRAAQKAIVRSGKGAIIQQKIRQLAEEPLSLSQNVMRLQGRPEFRLRVQDWRVIFRIVEGVLWIDDVGPRGSIY